MGIVFLRGARRGSALVIAVLLSLLVVFFMTVGGQLIATSHKETKIQQHVLTEADNLARAGLVDCISWFKRQTVQPVRSGVPPTLYSYPDAAFYPRYNANPLLRDTIDESTGLVKEFPITNDNSKWGRYELQRQTVNPASGGANVHAVRDITGDRVDGHYSGEGLVWYLESAGYIYKKVDPAKAYNVSPNVVLSRVRASTEIRRISLSLPMEAAFTVKNGGSGSTRTVVLNKNGRVMGMTGVGACRYSGNAPTVNTGATLAGSQASATITNDPTPLYVMGVSSADLKLLADYVVTDTSLLPATLPEMTLMFVDGNAVFSSTRPLVGSGVLFVNGNLSITAGSNSYFSGFIYATGTTTIYDPALISGAVVGYTGGTISRSGATSVAEIDYDSAILNAVRQQICQYRENKSTLHVFIGVPGLEN
ncbi:MAG: hypothetical protein WC421_00755 [Elusimicrobiales bacterium]